MCGVTVVTEDTDGYTLYLIRREGKTRGSVLYVFGPEVPRVCVASVTFVRGERKKVGLPSSSLTEPKRGDVP